MYYGCFFSSTNTFAFFILEFLLIVLLSLISLQEESELEAEVFLIRKQLEEKANQLAVVEQEKQQLIAQLE